MAKFKSFCFPKQKTLKKYLAKTLKMENHNGFLYRKGTIPIMLVAHMDTVHKESPKTIIDKDGKISSPEGIGGDDRCGIYMITEILKKHDCHVVFTEDEEVGGIGAMKFTKSDICKELKGNINYIIELDRKGSKDAVFYECGNNEFISFVTEKYFVEDWGTYSDICDIAPALDCSAVNISCGYYKAHTKDEYVVISEMNRNIKEVCKLIERSDLEKRFEWVDGFVESGWRYFDDYNDYYSYYGKGNKSSSRSLSAMDDYNIVWLDDKAQTHYDSTYGFSLEEAIGNFLIDNPSLSYNNIVEIYDGMFEREYML